MFLAVAVPILLQLHVPETTTELSQAVFDEIEKLKPGDKILISFDYDPGSEAELGPMATSFVHQCCEKKLKIYFMALWPVAPALIEENIRKVIQADFPDMVYGQDYVNLGLQIGERRGHQGRRHRSAQPLHDRRPRHEHRPDPHVPRPHEHPGHEPARLRQRRLSRHEGVDSVRGHSRTRTS